MEGDDGVRRTRMVRPPAVGDEMRAEVAKTAGTRRWEDLAAATSGRAGLPQ
jgi:hypothetical protein